TPNGSIGGGIVTGGAAAVFVPVPIATVNRRFVALNAVAGNLLPSPPSIDALGGADVKVSPGANNDPDTIALIDSPLSLPIPLAGTTMNPASSPSHSVRLFTFDGGLFTPIKPTPISIP